MANKQQLTVVRAGRLIDTTAGELLPARVVEIVGDRIESVGPDQGRYPDGARVIVKCRRSLACRGSSGP